MSTKSGIDPLMRETPPHERGNSKYPDFPISTSERERISQAEKDWEEKELEYEKSQRSGDSQKLPGSKSSGQSSPKKNLGKGSGHGWEDIKDPSTNSSEGEGGVHWLDGLRAENLSPAEFSDRIKQRNAKIDPDIERLKQLNAEMDVQMRHHQETAAVILKKKEELAALRAKGNPPPKRRVGRVGDRSSTENEYQRVKRERSARQKEYGESSQLLDWDKPKARNKNGRKSMGYEDIEDWWKPTHGEYQAPAVEVADESEPTKPSKLGKSKGYEDVEGWWKPSRTGIRNSAISTLEDRVRAKFSAEGVKWGEGLGAGGKHIQPFAGGHLPFHNEPEGPLDAAEKLQEQLDANEENKYKYKSSAAKKVQKPLDAIKQDKVKKSLPVPKEAVQKSPLSASHNGPHFQNDYAVTWSWKRALIILLTGMLLAAIILRIEGVTPDRRNVSGSSKWGLGKTVE
ncbi:hypothetical protein BOTCAL_0594g00070 [Botryotinia calthae]|uniref:Uncharacterized protein n=1 Tax=Botryotinia calthae TaxID=38488 RepID=A0A4Y8CJM1_9HELO|nr:hypothetical protein BOTCAL_0594g00070 [Botryotinia calthae]